MSHHSDRKESGEIAVSVGCMLSRVRTGMSNNEVTCAIPASRVSLLIERLRAARAADNAVAAYAAEDSVLPVSNDRVWRQSLIGAPGWEIESTPHQMSSIPRRAS
jgi:hypothetical protein